MNAILQPHQERVIDEQRELSEKINKLNIFLQSDKINQISVEEQERLKRQLHYMIPYSEVLSERIQNFK